MPYLYPEHELEAGLELLNEKGYSCFVFPEGDGIAFNNEKVPSENYYNDFCKAFPWMQIVNFEVGQELNPVEIYKCALVVMPLWRVLGLQTPIHAGRFSIFPAGEIFPQMMNIKRLDGKEFTDKSLPTSLRDGVTEATKVDFEVFTRLPVIAFTYNLDAQEFIKGKNNNYDVQLIRKLSKEANSFLDIIRYYFCEYNKPEFLPAQPGLWGDQFSTVLVYFPGNNCGFIQAGQADISETGFICQHALMLNTSILETVDLTNKFTQIMTLFEFLAYPNEYKNFKDVKKIIARHVAHSQIEYQKLLDRFQLLTSGIKDAENKQFIREGGYREMIVHWGKRIEDVFPESENIENLFSELQGYINVVINDMIAFYNKSWNEFFKLSGNS